MCGRALLTGTVGVCLVILLFSAVSPAQEKKEPSAPPAPAPEEESLKKAVGAPIDPKTYLIGAEDILQIRVWREPDLSGPVGVRPDGKISMPLIGDLQASGLTPEKLAETIKGGLTKYVTQPEVMVQVAAVNSKKYFVKGKNPTQNIPLESGDHIIVP